MPVTPSAQESQSILSRMSQSKFLRRYLGRPYLHLNFWIWNNLPAALAAWRPVRAYGIHLHSLIQLQAARRQFVGTFFFRNRPELELLVRLLDQKRDDSTFGVAVLACSKGTEVYSISFTIRSTRPNLKVNLQALDISEEILEFAEAGVYSLHGNDGPEFGEF